ADHLERRSVGRPGELLAKIPQLAQHGETARRQVARALHADVGIGIDGPFRCRLGGQRRALLLDPGQAAARRELLHQPGLEREQVLHVGRRVGQLRWIEGPPRPVVLLPRRRQRHAEVRLQQHVEAERLAAQEAGRDGGVEHRGERESVAALEMHQVVVTGVDDERAARVGEERPERREVGQRQRVYQPHGAVRQADLHEREPLRVVVQAVAFGVESDLGGGGQLVDGARSLRSAAGRLRSDSRIRVSTPIGHSTDTPMRWGLRSLASVSDSPTTAYLDVLYTPRPWLAMSPAIEAVLTMCPPSPPAIIRGTNVSIPWITPQRLTPRTHCQSRCVARSSPPHAATPALLQRTWTAPKTCHARSASAWTWPRSLTSVRTVSASTPCPRASPATLAIAPSSTSATTSRAPSRASASVSARPIPLPPPVTTATFPLNESMTLHGIRPRDPRQITHRRARFQGVGCE